MKKGDHLLNVEQLPKLNSQESFVVCSSLKLQVFTIVNQTT